MTGPGNIRIFAEEQRSQNVRVNVRERLPLS